jgi:type II secretory pathway component GspD/PulD (secretin)
MHAFLATRWTLSGTRRFRWNCALWPTLALVMTMTAPRCLAQQPSSGSSVSVVDEADSSTGITSNRPSAPEPVPVLSSPTSEKDALSAAAQAILKAAGIGEKPAEPAAPTRNNPFMQKAQAAPAAGSVAAAPGASPTANNSTGSLAAPAEGENLVIPAHPLDPNKAVVSENGGLVSLVVREGSLRQVIAMVAETQKLNIVFAGPTDTVVTAAFEKQPWQTVLDSLLAASGHAWTVRDNVIFVSSLDNVDFLPPGAEGRRVAVFELDFVSASDINQTITGILSPAGKSWLVETNKADNRRTKEAVAVMDYPANLQRIHNYICQADQPPRQVYIEAHILKVQLKDNCKSGVNFQNLISTNAADVTLRTVGMANASSPTAFFVEPKGSGLNGLIELLKTTTDAKTLASPTITAVSGQESHIQIGGQLGYRVTTTTQTSTLQSVQFLDVGVVLKVTPRVTRDGRVLMRIYPKVSTGQIDPSTELPSEDTTEVQTDVLLSSGQGVVIGGLIQETDNNITTKLPLLGEIPYLGILFQKREITRSRDEIIVTLQPHVLPYEPDLQSRLNRDFFRTTQPLTQGAIRSFPRPYEPAMYDVLNPKEHKLSGAPPYVFATDPAAGFGEPVELPSIIEPGPLAPQEAMPAPEELPEALPPPEPMPPVESLPPGKPMKS